MIYVYKIYVKYYIVLSCLRFNRIPSLGFQATAVTCSRDPIHQILYVLYSMYVVCLFLNISTHSVPVLILSVQNRLKFTIHVVISYIYNNYCYFLPSLNDFLNFNGLLDDKSLKLGADDLDGVFAAATSTAEDDAAVIVDVFFAVVVVIFVAPLSSVSTFGERHCV